METTVMNANVEIVEKNYQIGDTVIVVLPCKVMLRYQDYDGLNKYIVKTVNGTDIDIMQSDLIENNIVK